MFCRTTSLKQSVTIFALLLTAAGLLLYGPAVSAAVQTALSLCTQVLLPSLFPFFIVSALLIQSGLAQAMSRVLRHPMNRLFHLPGCCSAALLLGLFGGYPVGAKTAVSLYQSGLCGRAQTQRLLSFCNNCGPAFIISAVGSGLLGNVRLGLFLYLAHVLAALSVGLLLRGPQAESASSGASAPGTAQLGLSQLLAAVTDSFFTFLNVCAFVLLFAVILCLARQTGILAMPARLLSAIFPFPQQFFDGSFSGMLEVTSGAATLARLSDMPLRLLLPSLSFLLGFGGCSVHFQSISLMAKAGLSCGSYLFGKLLQAFLAAAYTQVFLWLLPTQAVAMGAFHATPAKGGSLLSGSLIAVSFCIFLAIWLVKRRRKRYNNKQSKGR